MIKEDRLHPSLNLLQTQVGVYDRLKFYYRIFFSWQNVKRYGSPSSEFASSPPPPAVPPPSSIPKQDRREETYGNRVTATRASAKGSGVSGGGMYGFECALESTPFFPCVVYY